MKKTVTINLADMVFHIDEDAYDQLKNYMDSIKVSLPNNESKEEIMEDIEARMAELFNDRLKSRKEVISYQDVQAIQEAMGAPSAFGEDDTEKSDANRPPPETNKANLYRDLEHNVVGGVCSGIGQYYNFDPIWLRLAFVLLIMLSGSGLLIYLILWVIIPGAKTPTQKMEMRGKRVTVSNIEKNFNNRDQQNTEQSSNTNHDNVNTKSKNFLATTFTFFEKLFLALGNACRKATIKVG